MIIDGPLNKKIQIISIKNWNMQSVHMKMFKTKLNNIDHIRIFIFDDFGKVEDNLNFNHLSYFFNIHNELKLIVTQDGKFNSSNYNSNIELRALIIITGERND